MDARGSQSKRPSHSKFANGSEKALDVVGVGIAAFLLFSLWTMPPAMVLSALSLAMLIVGGFLALSNWGDPAESRALTYKDVGGLLVFGAFGAALISDFEQVLPILEGIQRASTIR
jgi:glucose uptake protein GlcU